MTDYASELGDQSQDHTSIETKIHVGRFLLSLVLQRNRGSPEEADEEVKPRPVAALSLTKGHQKLDRRLQFAAQGSAPKRPA